MERLLAAQIQLKEALKREQKITHEMFEASANEKSALSELVEEAEKNKLKAEHDLQAAREEFISRSVCMRKEKIVRKKWTDVRGNEHVIEYIVL